MGRNVDQGKCHSCLLTAYTQNEDPCNESGLKSHKMPSVARGCGYWNSIKSFNLLCFVCLCVCIQELATMQGFLVTFFENIPGFDVRRTSSDCKASNLLLQFWINGCFFFSFLYFTVIWFVVINLHDDSAVNTTGCCGVTIWLILFFLSGSVCVRKCVFCSGVGTSCVSWCGACGWGKDRRRKSCSFTLPVTQQFQRWICCK